jgi:hypothetical protein
MRRVVEAPAEGDLRNGAAGKRRIADVARLFIEESA